MGTEPAETIEARRSLLEAIWCKMPIAYAHKLLPSSANTLLSSSRPPLSTNWGSVACTAASLCSVIMAHRWLPGAPVASMFTSGAIQPASTTCGMVVGSSASFCSRPAKRSATTSLGPSPRIFARAGTTPEAATKGRMLVSVVRLCSSATASRCSSSLPEHKIRTMALHACASAIVILFSGSLANSSRTRMANMHAFTSSQETILTTCGTPPACTKARRFEEQSLINLNVKSESFVRMFDTLCERSLRR
mmetsp:Transcript_163498/g.524226  ORF Transcript_163498/g.524226 Transcript_163498/m.524226 type:complete len:249 (-) Transcript_163498:3313-4059(-)